METIPSSRRPELARDATRRLVQVLAGFLLYAVLLFGSAGRLAWTWGWVFVGAMLIVLATNALTMPTELIAERGRKKPDAKRWDRVITALAGLPYLGLPVVAGLDARFGLSPALPLGLHLLALALYALSQALFTWAILSNRFFSSAVRLQLDRGHEVETGGPYRYVRHPGYLGVIVSTFATAPLLGSLWALVPAAVLCVLFVVRTVLEDRTLRAELPGYAEYARRTRHRLLPGLW